MSPYRSEASAGCWYTLPRSAHRIFSAKLDCGNRERPSNQATAAAMIAMRNSIGVHSASVQCEPTGDGQQQEENKFLGVALSPLRDHSTTMALVIGGAGLSPFDLQKGGASLP